MSEREEKVRADEQLLLAARKRGTGATLRAFLRLSGPGWLQSAITLGGGSLASALYLGVGENTLAARLGAGTVRTEGEKRVTLPLHVFVPVENLVFLPQAGGDRAEVHLQVATRDNKNGKLEFEKRLFKVSRPSDSSTEHVDFVVELDLKKSVYVVAVGLRDEASRETSFLSTTVAIQDPGQQGESEPSP